MNKIARLKKWNEYRSWPAGFYHMIIDSFEKGQLFNNDAEFAAGMNTVALGQYIHKIKILIFELMSNHAHFMVWSSGSDAVDFFIYQKKRINARLIKDGFPPLPDDLGFMLVPIDPSDPFQLQNGIIYIARNPHKADSMITPSGYLWGSSYLLFSNIGKIIQKKQVIDYSVDFMRNVLCSKTRLPDNYFFNDNLGIILPESYVLNQKTERILKSAWNYCNSLVKNICKNKYNVKSYLELSIDDRCRLGVRLFKDYHIDVKRICRKIGIEHSIMAELIK